MRSPLLRYGPIAKQPAGTWIGADGLEGENAVPEMNVTLKQLPRMRIISLRDTLPTMGDIGPLFTETYNVMLKRGVKDVAPCFSIYYNEELTGKDVDVEIAYPIGDAVTEDIALKGGRALTIRTLPTVPLAACAVYKGDYSGLSEFYGKLGQWISSHGYRITGPPREVYVKGGGGGDAITEIQFPVVRL